MKKIILASGSKNRQKLLSILGIPFKVVVSDFDESQVKGADAGIRARKIALGKALKAGEDNAGIIIAGDTFTVLDGRIMEKPSSLAEAKSQVLKLSGSLAACYTGFCYFDSLKNKKVCKTAITKVWFRKIYASEVENYIKKFPVKTWAASYAPSEAYVLGMVKRISGSLTGLTHGLPCEYLIPLLRKEGFTPKP
jgi:septum formation protein